MPIATPRIPNEHLPYLQESPEYDEDLFQFNTGKYSLISSVTYNFFSHNHPFVPELLSNFKRESLAGLLDVNFHQKLNNSDPSFFDREYSPNRDVIGTIPEKKIDVRDTGAYSIYNWELFFHAPLTIAVHLSKNQRFDEAQKWFHYIFDPTSNDDSVEPPQRFWKFLAFRERSDEALINDLFRALSNTSEDPEIIALKEKMLTAIREWQNKPFQPHAIARTRFLAYQFQVVMKYLDNLIAWGDHLFLQDTIETINEATQQYVLAANILGPVPQQIPRRGISKPKTFAMLRGKLDAFNNALTELEGAFPFNLHPLSMESGDADRSNSLFEVTNSLYFCIPKNEKLLEYWDIVADRLFKIRHCMNIEGLVRQLPLFEPPINPGMLVKAAAAGIDISSLVNETNQPASPIRAVFFIQKALEICNEVRSLGNNLLSVLEKKESEALSLLRQRQEIKMLELASDTRYLQWKEAEANTDALVKSRESTFQRYRYYQMLLGKPTEAVEASATLTVERSNMLEGATHEEGKAFFQQKYNELIGRYAAEIPLDEYYEISRDPQSELNLSTRESLELNVHMPRARSKQDEALELDNIFGLLGMLPNLGVDFKFWGIGGHFEFGGPALAAVGRIVTGNKRGEADGESHRGNLVSRVSSYERRIQEWINQSNSAAKELVQIGRQIVASLIREQIAKKEYENHNQQIEHAKDIDAFLQNKFTNQELYGWMQSEYSKIFYDCYRFAFDLARKAEQTMKFELMRAELEGRNFIKFNYWDSGRKGLCSGEALYLDLKRMEIAYHEYNKREFEIIKHISLRQLNPLALLQLKATGSCIVDIPEWIFDLDCPGHFLRRIKSLSVSIPAIVGPYTSINCTLSLQKSTVRKNALVNEGYARGDQDGRFIDYYGLIQSIVTSNAQNDTGTFEVNLGDERYLPFENAGAISRWQIDLPDLNRQFNYDTITDVIMHLRYTARQGGAELKEEAEQDVLNMIQTESSSGLFRLFSLKHDFPSEWHRYVQGEENMVLTIKKHHFPYFAQGSAINGNIQLWQISSKEVNPIPGPEVISFDNDVSERQLSFTNLNKELEIFMVVHYTLR